MNSSTKIDNRKKIVSFLVKVLHKDKNIHCLPEKIYSINFSENSKKKLFELPF